jgi:hypothetical protein
LLLVAAIGVGAFVYAGSDTSAGRKSTATVVKEESANSSNTSTVTTVKKADSQPVTSNSVASASPTPKPSSDDNVFHVGDDAKPELDGYEARKVFVGVSPSYAVVGRKLEVQVRGFGPGEIVKVEFIHSVNGVTTVGGGADIKTDQRGRGKGPAVAPATGDVYLVKAVGQTSKRSAAASLKVVLKK